jgi:hypothetical protein
VSALQYFGTILTNENCIEEEINSKSENYCFGTFCLTLGYLETSTLFASKREKVAGGWGNLHKEELLFTEYSQDK